MNLEVLKRMKTDDLRRLHEATRVELITREDGTGRASTAPNSFKRNDLVFFHTRQGDTIHMRVERINQQTLSGVQINPETLVSTGRKWRVSPVFCAPFSLPKAVAPVGVGAGSF